MVVKWLEGHNYRTNIKVTIDLANQKVAIRWLLMGICHSFVTSFIFVLRG